MRKVLESAITLVCTCNSSTNPAIGAYLFCPLCVFLFSPSPQSPSYGRKVRAMTINFRSTDWAAAAAVTKAAVAAR